jgi:hypothetical protein
MDRNKLDVIRATYHGLSIRRASSPKIKSADFPANLITLGQIHALRNAPKSRKKIAND